MSRQELMGFYQLYLQTALTNRFSCLGAAINGSHHQGNEGRTQTSASLCCLSHLFHSLHLNCMKFTACLCVFLAPVLLFNIHQNPNSYFWQVFQSMFVYFLNSFITRPLKNVNETEVFGQSEPTLDFWSRDYSGPRITLVQGLLCLWSSVH